jgi:hypothetical protein
MDCRGFPGLSARPRPFASAQFAALKQADSERAWITLAGGRQRELTLGLTAPIRRGDVAHVSRLGDSRRTSPPPSGLQRRRRRSDQIVHFLVQDSDVLGQVFNLGEGVRLGG